MSGRWSGRLMCWSGHQRACLHPRSFFSELHASAAPVIAVANRVAVQLVRPRSAMRAFLRNGALGRIVLIVAALAVMGIANSPLAPAYFAVLEHHLGPLSVLHWINDGLMTLFFLLVGLRSSASWSMGISRPDRIGRCRWLRHSAA